MFTPKKIGAGSVGAAKYYAEDSHREDYYAKGKEPPGVWQGGKSLGLDGKQVESACLERLFQGYDPAGRALVRGPGSGMRLVGTCRFPLRNRCRFCGERRMRPRARSSKRCTKRP